MQIWPAPHAVPQPPQFAGSEFVSTHAYPARTEPQAVRPAEQAFTQAPFSQRPRAQLVPHAPQCAGSSSRLTHVAPLPQLVSPRAQESALHTLALQRSPLAQCLLQAPHAWGSFAGFRHAMPFGVVQSVLVADAHAALHVPLSQLADPVAPPLTGASQTVPHVPQSFGFFDVSTQPSGLHFVVGDAHVVVQLPPEQTLPDAHFVPHVPQLPRSVASSASHPFFTSPSQSANPALHAIAHLPALQLAVPFVPSHTVPQAPQLPVSFVASTQAPSHKVPDLHVVLQEPAMQRASAPVGASHCCPHPPQLLASVVVSAQASPHRVWACGHATMQVPFAQTSFAPHEVEQDPQCFESTRRFAQSVPHTEYPCSHATAHCPFSHVVFPFAEGCSQPVAQPPQ